MSQLKVNAIRHTGASSDAVTLASDGTCTAKITNNLSNRNLIINGEMQVAQRGTPSSSTGHATVDRFAVGRNGLDEDTTQAQHALTASDTGPWEKGHRFSYHLTNGNQTSGAQTQDYVFFYQNIEAQYIANSGWDYTSASSYITLSFWIKSSVAQNFYGYLRTRDGTQQSRPFETGALSADTWTKITKVIPGNSNIQIDSNNQSGLGVYFTAFFGTHYTTNAKTVDTWSAYVNEERTPDQTSTWWTTNDATFEITGVQLEVSDHATEFERLPYGVELARCQRYYFQENYTGNYELIGSTAPVVGTAAVELYYSFPVSMRTGPTITNNGVGNFRIGANGNDATVTGISTSTSRNNYAILRFTRGGTAMTVGTVASLNTEANNDAALYFDAEI